MIDIRGRVPHAAPSPAPLLVRWAGPESCVEALNIERPKLVMKVHRRFIKAGAEVVFTNSGGAAPQLLRSFRMFDEAFAVSYLSAELARTVANEASHKVQVVGDVRLPWRVPVTGFMTGAEIETAAQCLVSAQIAGGADSVLLDVAARPDLLTAALNGARWGMTEARRTVPLMLLLRPVAAGQGLVRERMLDDLAAAACVAATSRIAALGVVPGEIPERTRALLDRILPFWSGPIALSPMTDAKSVREVAEDPIAGSRMAFLPSASPPDLRRVIKTSLGRSGASDRRTQT